MKVQTERRKQVREAYQQERPHWLESLDEECKRRLSESDRPRSVPSSLPAFK